MSGYVEKHLMPQHYQGMLCNFVCSALIEISLAPNLYIMKLIELIGYVFWSQPASGNQDAMSTENFLMQQCTVSNKVSIIFLSQGGRSKDTVTLKNFVVDCYCK